MKLLQTSGFWVFFLIPFLGKTQTTSYFQQELHYNINVTLIDSTHELRGEATIEYINNAPQALDKIYMHIWPNAYKNEQTALCKQLMANGNLSLYYADSIDRGYIDEMDFRVDGAKIKWQLDPEHIDIAILYLTTPVQPQGKITISTPFHVKIPDGKFSRLGHVGQSYQITQWYPKPAVYDNEGWHQMPYLNQGEFFSEFGSFDVSITLPENYVLSATGDLADGEKEMAWLTQKADATKAITTFPDDMSFPVSSEKNKTLRFRQSNVHDFAWFADKRYHVLKGEVELPYSKNKVTTWAMFTNSEAHLWKRSIEYINDATYYYSLWNGDYPYQHVTAVDGTISAGGGMEYPNITVIGRSGNALGLETVIMHEVGHNWFYGILGNNERTHAWLDEGLNSFNENRYMETKYPDRLMVPEPIAKHFRLNWLNHKGIFYIGYLINARRSIDQPIDGIHSGDYTDMNYGSIVYGKSALVFDYLMAYLGEEKFDKCMKTYFEQWKFKHPRPEDLRAVFEEVSGENLAWFFDDVLKTTKHLDYKIAGKGTYKGVEAGGSGMKLLIRNKGEINGPFVVSQVNKKNEVLASQWYKAGTRLIDFDPLPDAHAYRIDPGLDMPETNRNNNTFRVTGIFPKLEKPRLQFAGVTEDPERSTLFWMPISGWNESDHFMPGVALYNGVLPQRKFEFAVAPMYSIVSNSVTGYGEIAYNLFPKKTFGNIRFSLSAATFHSAYTHSHTQLYSKLTPKADLRFRKKNLRNPKSHRLVLSSVFVREDATIEHPDAPVSWTERIINDHIYNEIHYSFHHNLPLNPYAFHVALEQHRSFFKGALTFNYHINYNQNKRGLDVTLFAGKFINNNLEISQETPRPSRYYWQMDGQNGFEDYSYQAVFPDRGGIGKVFSQQYINNHGNFKVPVSIGNSGDWLGAVNFRSWLPVIPFNAFADMGWSPYHVFNATTRETRSEIRFMYDAGVSLSLFGDRFEIHVPLFFSSNIKDDLEYNDISFLERIRFTFHLPSMNPLKMARKF